MGIGSSITGLGIALVGAIQLKGVENIDHLVTSRLFFRLPHPMYTGFILSILGWIIYNGAVFIMIAEFISSGNIPYWRGLEEE